MDEASSKTRKWKAPRFMRRSEIERISQKIRGGWGSLMFEGGKEVLLSPVINHKELCVGSFTILWCFRKYTSLNKDKSSWII